MTIPRGSVTTIDVGEYGANLLDRERAVRVREYLDERVGGEHWIELDFARVVSVTPSFADECFGVLVERLAGEPERPTIRLVNTSADVRAVLRFALAHRLDMARASA